MDYGEFQDFYWGQNMNKGIYGVDKISKAPVEGFQWVLPLWQGLCNTIPHGDYPIVQIF